MRESSSPNAGAMWTTPVPSPSVTMSDATTTNAPSVSAKKSNTGTYARPTNAAPLSVPTSSQPSSASAYAARLDAASTTFVSSAGFRHVS